jgi:hypothetical protein
MKIFIKFGVVKEASRISYHEWQLININENHHEKKKYKLKKISHMKIN